MEKEKFEQLHIEDKDQPIGLGGEKKVFEDKANPERVIGLYRSHEERRDLYPTTERQVKARFYLIKIAHLLFPQNIPDAQFSYSEPNAMARTKVNLSEDRRRLNVAEVADEILAEQTDQRKLDDETARNLYMKQYDYSEVIGSNSQYGELVSKLEKAGYNVDATGINFNIDSSGKMTFLDEFSPWKIDSRDKQITVGFDVDRLQKAIDMLPENDKERAKNYLERVNANLQEERSLLNEKVD